MVSFKILPKLFGKRLKLSHHQIFCDGPLLDIVQRAKLFKDSKHFVDMPLKTDAETVFRAFKKLPPKPDREILRQFVHAHFDEPGTELVPFDPPDWVPCPKKFEKIKDPKLLEWALELNLTWRILCRKMLPEVEKHPERYSIVFAPDAFVIPGGRFREFYYWDTFWIIKGLLASEMYRTARGMILNLAAMIEKFGFIPNGGRIYLLNRTQPPFLTGMVKEYLTATQDFEFCAKILPLLEKEYEFFQNHRRFEIKRKGDKTKFSVYRYKVQMTKPRPESYSEDLETVENVRGRASDCNEIFSEIAAACESGWDFSTRWMNPVGPFANQMQSIRTSRLIPVDLNSILCWNELLMAEMFQNLGEQRKADFYQQLHIRSKAELHELFWNESHGVWFDLDLDKNGRHNEKFFASNVFPLGLGIEAPPVGIHRRVAEYLKECGALQDNFAIPTSLNRSGQQWDAPNGFSPTISILIEGLRRSQDPAVQDLAFKIAQKWIHINYECYIRSNKKMFEKYNVEDSLLGHGGEYEVQEGFGWTNGVILDLLITYGDRLKVPPVGA